jgi:hypothetical protein
MAGGDAVAVHHTIRNLLADYCRRGRLQPELEAPGLLRDLPVPEGRRRPANVLVCAGACLAPNLPDGARPHRLPRVALDIAVINALGANHWQRTFQEPGRAAADYSDRKRRFQDTARKCRDAGVDFVPLVFEHQGGTTPEGTAVLHAISAAVATAEAREAAEVREELLGRIAVVLARANARAVVRRASAVLEVPPEPHGL